MTGPGGAGSGPRLATLRRDAEAQADVVLTQPAAVPGLGALQLGLPGTYLIAAQRALGASPTFVQVGGAVRSLWLPEGTYQVDRREGSEHWSGPINIYPGQAAWCRRAR